MTSASLGTPQGSLRVPPSLSSLYLQSLLSLKGAFSNYSFGVFKHCQKVGLLALPCSPQTCLPVQTMQFWPICDQIRGGAGELRQELTILALLLHSVTPKPSHGCICSSRSVVVPDFQGQILPAQCLLACVSLVIRESCICDPFGADACHCQNSQLTGSYLNYIRMTGGLSSNCNITQSWGTTVLPF